MWDRGSVEGSHFVSHEIIMFSDNYFSLKKCVKNKKNEGFKNIVINLFEYDGEYYKTAFESIRRISNELDVGISVKGVSKAKVDYNSFPYINFI